MSKKNEPYICPKCGGDVVTTADYEIDANCLHQELLCEKCGEMWDEYHELIYRGYAYEGVDYDENGEIEEF